MIAARVRTDGMDRRSRRHGRHTRTSVSSIRRLGTTASVLSCLVVTAALVPFQPAAAAPTTNCGPSGSHTLCITVPDTPLTADATVTVTNAPNTGKVIVTWLPDGGSTTALITRVGPSPATNDYSFVWPTKKYRDATGHLEVRFSGSTNVPVQVPVTLANGNLTDFQHAPGDWASFLPGGWTGASDPVIAAVGDGPDDRPTANAVAASIGVADPPLFLFLGDIYEKGTFTENLNMYGVSSLDVPTGGTLWGKLADKTQPTLGNHESPVAWQDYWHRRPTFISFTFGGVLFLDLNSQASFKPGSAQYTFVQNALGSAPPCVVAFWHIPVLSGDTISTARQPMWALLADNGGDLVLNGHNHSMIEYRPLAADLTTPGHMVQLVSGAGGHGLGSGKSGIKVAWVLGKTAGVLYLTLNGGAGGGIASSLSWSFKKTDGTIVRNGSVAC